MLVDGNTKKVYGLGLVSVETPTSKAFVHLDRLGSVIAAGDKFGYMVAHIKYDEWGSLTVLMAGLTPDYTGHEWDSTLQIYYAKARFYEAGDRRFTAEDIVKGGVANPQSLVAYIYVENNPFMYVDPDGRYKQTVTRNGIKLDGEVDEKSGQIYFSIVDLMILYGIKGENLDVVKPKDKITGEPLPQIIYTFENDKKTAVITFNTKDMKAYTDPEFSDGVKYLTRDGMIFVDPNYFHKLMCGIGKGQMRYAITRWQLESMIQPYKEDANGVAIGGISLNATINDLGTINRVLNDYNINSAEKARHFFAQVAHESKVGLIEKYNGNSAEAYFANRDFRPEYGHNTKGDGAKYRGAGYIHLTWKSNYQGFADFIRDQNVVLYGASYVAEHYAWESAGWFWAHEKKLNAEVEKGATVKDITSKINGGSNGLAERTRFYERLKTIL